MAPQAAPCLNEHSDLHIENGALIFPMPAAVYDQLADTKNLPRGACYNGARGALEVDAVPNGRYHDPRAGAVYDLFTELQRASGTPAYVGATAPVEGGRDDRRHPDVQFFVSPAKLGALDAASRPAPIPDLVVEIDTTPLSEPREHERRDAYLRLGVPELWIWKRTGGSEARPNGAAIILIAGHGAWREAHESSAVPGMRPRDLEVLMHEPGDLTRSRNARKLAARLAPAFALTQSRTTGTAGRC